MFYAAISYYYELSNELVEKNYSQTTHHSTKFRNWTTRTTLFAMLALLQLSFEVLASSKPMVLLSLSFQSVIPPSTPSNSAHQQLCWELASYKVDYFSFSPKQSLIIFRKKVILLLVSGSNEKKEMQYSDVRT